MGLPPFSGQLKAGQASPSDQSVPPIARDTSVSSSEAPDASMSPTPHSFKVGDKVKVVKATDTGRCMWVQSMEDCIGNEYVIDRIGDWKVHLKGVNWGIPLSSLAPAEYKPEVGDVVEFEYKGTKYQGLIFQTSSHKSFELPVAYFTMDGQYCDWVRSNAHRIQNLVKTGHIVGNVNTDNYMSIAKAYFSRTFSPDPDKSYEENQKAWVEFHGIKVGSKVKVTRTVESKENGWCRETDLSAMVGIVYKVGWIYPSNGFSLHMVDSRVGNGMDVPYFALEPA